MPTINSARMSRNVLPLLVTGLLLTTGFADEADLPRLKFFYFESTNVEWVVSSEPDAYLAHLEQNEASNALITSLDEAVHGDEQPSSARSFIASWITRQRESFEQGRTASLTFRRAEGIVAYLRAHDFRIRNLIRALKRRSGASAVELIAIHQASGQTSSEFKLKVVLEEAKLDIGRMGYNIDLQSPEVSYVTAVYALARALYEVHELIGENSPPEELPSPLVEELESPLRPLSPSDAGRLQR